MNLLAYVPVIHQGYISFIERNADHKSTFFILGDSFVSEFSERREIRAISATTARELIDALRLVKYVRIVSGSGFHNLEEEPLLIANDDVCRGFAEKYLKNRENVSFDTVFLRWDQSSVACQENVADDRVSSEPFDIRMIEQASDEAQKSSDWWRQVGCVAVRNGNVVESVHNHHVPTEQTPYINGDPRDVILAGTQSHLATAIHAEQSLIAVAASEKLRGCDVYLSTFPCPLCAKLLAFSGIRRCFYGSGHANLDGQSILKVFGVEIIRVEK